MKPRVAVFDFDGTLTNRDTFLAFIRFACGTFSFYWGFVLYSPLLLLMLMHLYPNWKAKERVFSHFFKGWEYRRFLEKCDEFAWEVKKIEREQTVTLLRQHLASGDRVYVISASIEEWVRPWCRMTGDVTVLGTRIAVGSDGLLTGRFLGRNCYGQEKVARLLEVEPERNSYDLYAYGDSRGDREMIEFADYGSYINGKGVQ